MQMRRLALLLFAAATICSSVALGAAYAPKQSRIKYGTLVPGTTGQYEVLSDVAANATAANRTFAVKTSGYAKLTVSVVVTARSAATAVTMTCSYSQDNGTNYTPLGATTVVVSGGAAVGTVVPYTDSYAISTTQNAPFEYDVRTYDYFRCVVGLTGGGAGDVFDAQASAAVGA
jgi:hypothetical protein